MTISSAGNARAFASILFDVAGTTRQERRGRTVTSANSPSQLEPVGVEAHVKRNHGKLDEASESIEVDSVNRQDRVAGVAAIRSAISASATSSECSRARPPGCGTALLE